MSSLKSKNFLPLNNTDWSVFYPGVLTAWVVTKNREETKRSLYVEL